MKKAQHFIRASGEWTSSLSTSLSYHHYSVLPGEWLSTGHRCWPPPPPLVRSRYMCTSMYQHPLRRPSVWSFWTICVEQPPHRTPPVWSLSGTVPPSAENVFVLTGSAAPSDCLLLGVVYKFAYLLTYYVGKYSPTISEATTMILGIF